MAGSSQKLGSPKEPIEEHHSPHFLRLFRGIKSPIHTQGSPSLGLLAELEIDPIGIRIGLTIRC